MNNKLIAVYFFFPIPYTGLSIEGNFKGYTMWVAASKLESAMSEGG